MTTITLRTPKQVRDEFSRRGLSIASWARENGFPPPLVYRVLSGVKPQRGLTHDIAVALGLKEGEASNLPFRQHRSQKQHE